MTAHEPARELTDVLKGEPPGRALDLACGSGRHSRWLAERGWQVLGVDLVAGDINADLEKHEYKIEPAAWDLIVCWLYWQPDLMPEIAAGVKPGGIAACAGKNTGRFATSLALYRAAFPGWAEMVAEDNERRAVFIARKPPSPVGRGME